MTGGAAQPLPCPFCGGAGLRHVPRELDGGERPALDLDGALFVSVTGDGWYAVRCSDCYAMGPRVHATRASGCAKAIEAWNGRTIWA